ncbi:MAG: tRNA (adenosine(37)-N6)-dimethylallyltransferase MiaA, partial [Pseudomonadota bacterium]
MKRYISRIPDDRPVLVVGPTASGKSDLALAIAETQGGVIVNADASQVYDCWRVITARPSSDDEARAPHALYGHLPYDAPYSAGHWLRELKPVLCQGPRPIIVGGTGLYFSALTDGLAEIPATPPEMRAEADKLTLEILIDGLDATTKTLIDLSNRARVQRAWEVLRSTGRSLADWQAEPATPLLPLSAATGIVLDAPKEWLTPRIARRFDLMLARGGLDEAKAMQDRYDPALPGCRAIGVKETMDLLASTAASWSILSASKSM